AGTGLPAYAKISISGSVFALQKTRKDWRSRRVILQDCAGLVDREEPTSPGRLWNGRRISSIFLSAMPLRCSIPRHRTECCVRYAQEFWRPTVLARWFAVGRTKPLSSGTLLGSGIGFCAILAESNHSCSKVWLLIPAGG